MKKFKLILGIFLTSIFLYGCSSTFNKQPDVEPELPKTFYASIKEDTKSVKNSIISPDCINVAKYARSIAVLKEAGIPYTSLGDFIPNQQIKTDTIKVLQFYSLGYNGSPVQLYTDIMLTCHKVGIDNLESVIENKLPKASDSLKISPELTIK